MDYKKINQIPMFFIVGIPRSGTTMLQQMLDANPSVITPLECRIVVHLKQRFFRIKTWTDQKVNEFIEVLFEDQMFVSGWNVDKKQLSEAYHQIPLSEVSYTLLLKMAYYSYPSIYDKNEIRILGDKNPLYTMFIDEIKEIFPDAKFIHIIRDYRANVLSNRKWFLRKKISILSHKWLVGNLFVEKQKSKNPTDFYTVRYEDLVDNPEKYAKEIAKFLNVGYTPSMISFHEKANEVYHDSNSEKATTFHKELVETLHENIIKPIHKDKVDTWKTELTPKEIALADYVAADYAAKYNYKPLYHERSFEFWKKSILGKIRIDFDMFVIREYQKFPTWLRKLFRQFSLMLFKVFGVGHIFNPELNRQKRGVSKL
jgi:hypothetical protein